MSEHLKALAVKDFDVLGIGAVRRNRLLQNSGQFILETHPELVPPNQQAVYQAVLEETLRWLKPEQIRPQKLPEKIDDFVERALQEELQKEFPQTVRFLKTDLEKAVQGYLQEFPWQGPLLSAQLRYFPVFLRKVFRDSHLYGIAQKEWLWSYLSFADFGGPLREEGRILVNPSLQSLYSTCEISEVQLAEGLSIFYYDETRQKVREYKPDIYDAAVVDTLQEDRKFTLDQLIEQVMLMDLEVPLPREEWLKKLFYLKAEGIILESGSKWISQHK